MSEPKSAIQVSAQLLLQMFDLPEDTVLQHVRHCRCGQTIVLGIASEKLPAGNIAPTYKRVTSPDGTCGGHVRTGEIHEDANFTRCCHHEVFGDLESVARHYNSAFFKDGAPDAAPDNRV